jgi:hypothetical protein
MESFEEESGFKDKDDWDDHVTVETVSSQLWKNMEDTRVCIPSDPGNDYMRGNQIYTLPINLQRCRCTHETAEWSVTSKIGGADFDRRWNPKFI